MRHRIDRKATRPTGSVIPKTQRSESMSELMKRQRNHECDQNDAKQHPLTIIQQGNHSLVNVLRRGLGHRPKFAPCRNYETFVRYLLSGTLLWVCISISEPRENAL